MGFDVFAIIAIRPARGSIKLRCNIVKNFTILQESIKYQDKVGEFHR